MGEEVMPYQTISPPERMLLAIFRWVRLGIANSR